MMVLAFLLMWCVDLYHAFFATVLLSFSHILSTFYPNYGNFKRLYCEPVLYKMHLISYAHMSSRWRTVLEFIPACVRLTSKLLKTCRGTSLVKNWQRGSLSSLHDWAKASTVPSVSVFLNHLSWRDPSNNFIARWILPGSESSGSLGSEFSNERVAVFCSKTLSSLLSNVFSRTSCDLFESDSTFWPEPIDGSGLYFENDDCDLSGVGKDACSPTTWKFSLEAMFSFLSPDLGRNRPLADLGRHSNFSEEVLEGGRGTNDAWPNENSCPCEMSSEVWRRNKLPLTWGWLCIILVLCWAACVLSFVYTGKGLSTDLLLGGLLPARDWGRLPYFPKKKK